ncbi:MAG: hypothetical protein COV91_00760 [Candidatus Taylorbacteria bacterium CG11_big_fil_rev_8_21_14_0_20_46_11]|uniref:Homing endonuclease LAGLIDADG domain-containing protein n=1 Tax=Candidatus Taylorbacteria bacterium CG11_big_fil_rev_8_21_14_0_20_46_11 TaxID=1975025 RepID=A0A2H0KFB0_9BACT|nr:MAG: hypothetical protein COV91_00760 [Candidatus Taylorbacteria bacterium CG11_big_fil_rev_8_21_14_0_20_46_11]
MSVTRALPTAVTMRTCSQSAGKALIGVIIRGMELPSNIGWYLSGFCDGEGSFNVSLRMRKDHKLQWQVVLTFNVAQRDVTNLLILQKYLQCGRLQKRSDGVHYFVVTNYKELIEKVIPFFERFPLQSVLKKKNFEIFRQATNIVYSGRHLTPKGFMEVVELREGLNEGKGRKRKYEKSHVIADYQRILRDYTPNSTLLIENNEMI